MNRSPLIFFRSTQDLEQGVEQIMASPKDSGELKLIAARPERNQRKVLFTAELNTEVGLVGDNWLSRGGSYRPDRSANPDMQLNIMNSRVIELIAGAKQNWALAGDQLYVELDLSKNNLPAGTRLRLGTAEIEVTAEPHTACQKFSARFGRDAALFTNSDLGKTNCFRGICAKVVRNGKVSTGDPVIKL